MHSRRQMWASNCPLSSVQLAPVIYPASRPSSDRSFIAWSMHLRNLWFYSDEQRIAIKSAWEAWNSHAFMTPSINGSSMYSDEGRIPQEFQPNQREELQKVEIAQLERQLSLSPPAQDTTNVRYSNACTSILNLTWDSFPWKHFLQPFMLSKLCHLS